MERPFNRMFEAKCPALPGTRIPTLASGKINGAIKRRSELLQSFGHGGLSVFERAEHVAGDKGDEGQQFWAHRCSLAGWWAAGLNSSLPVPSHAPHGGLPSLS